jgi:hypothetical protein
VLITQVRAILGAAAKLANPPMASQTNADPADRKSGTSRSKRTTKDTRPA